MKRLALFSLAFFLVFPLRAQQEEKEIQSSYGWSLNDFSSSSKAFYEELEIYLDLEGNNSFDQIRANEQLFTPNNSLDNYQSKKIY